MFAFAAAVVSYFVQLLLFIHIYTAEVLCVYYLFLLVTICLMLFIVRGFHFLQFHFSYFIFWFVCKNIVDMMKIFFWVEHFSQRQCIIFGLLHVLFVCFVDRQKGQQYTAAQLLLLVGTAWTQAKIQSTECTLNYYVSMLVDAYR